MKNNIKRKKIYISVCLNFFIGAILGIILFHSQLKNQLTSEETYILNKNVTFLSFLRLLWIDLLWFFALFISKCITPAVIIHPIMAVRGCICSFSVSVVMKSCGILEAFSVITPQCASLFPIMTVFSAMIIEKRARARALGFDPNTLKKTDALSIFLLAALAAASELTIFKILTYLF